MPGFSLPLAIDVRSQTENRAMRSVFTYTNFRKYLKDYYREQKKANPEFSHRWLVSKVGLTTSNYFLSIMEGKRNLPSDVSLRLTRHLGLTRKETLYFEYMVAYVQSKTGFEKKEYLSRMADLNPGRRKKKR
jgi:uncharacterized protein (TIGR02147 family)